MDIDDDDGHVNVRDHDDGDRLITMTKRCRGHDDDVVTMINHDNELKKTS